MADMTGRICLVTGATNGIGEVTARELARMGATVVIVGRSAEKTQRVANEIKTLTGNQNVDYLLADLSSMAEVRKLAAEFKAKYSQLHVLVNNAGAVFMSKQTTVDGFEITFALNHLSYFLLTHLLLDTLKASGTPQHKARIVNVSSDAHRSGIDLDNLQGEKKHSNLYGQSKMANILFTYELARRLQQEGANVTANVLHPGLVATGFAQNNGTVVATLAKVGMNLAKMVGIALSVEEGAKTSIYLASSPEVENITGKYFVKSKQTNSSTQSMNEALWVRLWEISEDLLGIKSVAPVQA